MMQFSDKFEGIKNVLQKGLEKEIRAIF